MVSKQVVLFYLLRFMKTLIFQAIFPTNYLQSNKNHQNIQ